MATTARLNEDNVPGEDYVNEEKSARCECERCIQVVFLLKSLKSAHYAGETRIGRSDYYARYQEWCRERGIKARGWWWFAEFNGRLGLKRGTTGEKRFYDLGDKCSIGVVRQRCANLRALHDRGQTSSYEDMSPKVRKEAPPLAERMLAYCRQPHMQGDPTAKQLRGFLEGFLKWQAESLGQVPSDKLL